MDGAEGPFNNSWHFLAAESPAKSSVPAIGIVVGLLLLMAAAAGGALLWRRMRNGLPGVGQEEGRASNRGIETSREGDTDLGGQI